MQVTVHFSYVERDVIPPRCRKPRDVYHEDGVTTVEIREISSDVFPLAIRLEGRYDGTQELHWFEESLWKTYYPQGSREEGLQHFLLQMGNGSVPGWFGRRSDTFDENVADIQSQGQEYILVDGYPYQKAGEPRFVVMTFGLGHNHGGTAVMLDSYYNSNIHKSRYFRLDEADKAQALATKIATKRGDTNDVPMRMTAVEIFIPECIRCNPQVEGGEGDPFLNQLYGISESSDSVAEAGIRSILALARTLKDE